MGEDYNRLTSGAVCEGASPSPWVCLNRSWAVIMKLPSQGCLPWDSACQSASGWLTWGTLSARTWEPQLTSRNGGTAVGEYGALATWALSRGRQFAMLHEPLGTGGDCTESADWVGTQCTLSSAKRISWEFSTHTVGEFDMGTSRRGRCGYVWSLSAR